MLVLATPSVTDEELEAFRVCQLGPGGARAPGDSRRDRLSGGPAAGGRSGPFSAARSRGMYPLGLPRFAATKSLFVDPFPGRNLRGFASALPRRARGRGDPNALPADADPARPLRAYDETKLGASGPLGHVGRIGRRPRAPWTSSRSASRRSSSRATPAPTPTTKARTCGPSSYRLTGSTRAGS
jgi:hypothetical protein